MGAHPYDECSPLFSGGNPQQCNGKARAGSIFAGTAAPAAPEAPLPPGSTPTPAPQPPNALQPAEEIIPGAVPAVPAPDAVKPSEKAASPQAGNSEGWKASGVQQAKRPATNSRAK
jgi:hypothetical protein